MRFNKLFLAATIVASVAVGAGSAIAAGQFTDVDDSRYYADAVAWAVDNGITTGCGEGQFCPDDNVTRGQNVTFAWRYDQYVVQPALDAADSDVTALEDAMGGVESDVAGLQHDVADALSRVGLVLRDGEDVYPAVIPTNGETFYLLIDGRWWAYSEYDYAAKSLDRLYESADCTGTAYVARTPLQNLDQIVIGGTWHEVTRTGAGTTINVGSYRNESYCTLTSYSTDGFEFTTGPALTAPPTLNDPYFDFEG